MKDHIPLVSTLQPGAIIIRFKNEEHFFAVSKGVIEVEHDRVRILSDIADRAESLEESAIEQAKDRAEKALLEKDRADSEGFAEATAILDREIARLKSVRRRRPGRSMSS
jgi:F-type H+-transporting ATPase subunit epsilon